MQSKIQILVVLMIAVSSAMFGQVDSTTKKLQNVAVDIDVMPDIDLDQSEKISENPSFKDSIEIKSEMKYSMKDKKVDSDFKVKTIKAPSIKGPMTVLPKLYKGYLKFGMSDFTSPPFLDAYYGSKYDRNSNYSVKLNHFSSDLDIENLSDVRFTETGVGFAGKKFMNHHTLFAEADYNFNTNRYYGTKIQFTDDELAKQHFSMGNVKMGYQSHFKNEKVIQQKMVFEYKNLFDNYGAMEHQGEFNMNLSTKFMEEYISGDAGVRYVGYTTSNSNLNSFLVNLKPRVKRKREKYSFELGLNAFLYRDDTTGFHIYPFAEAHYSLIKDVFTVYAKFQGDFDGNTYWDHVNTNPFVSSNIPYTNTRHIANFFGGIKGNISSKVSFNLGFESDKVKNMAFYVNDTSSFGNSRFTIVNDNVTISRAFGQITWDLKKFNFALNGDYRDYDIFSEEKAWHLPQFEIGFMAKYNFQDMLFIHTNFYYYGDQFARVYENGLPVAQKLNGVIDFNAGVEYKYNKRLGAFVNVNNILSQRHLRWNQYPNYGLNFLGGFSYSF